MEKRYQIFISSTFIDLADERQAALKAILELNHMPAGMELFPPTDDSAWRLICDVIDSSDYYLIIIGGRYGSVDEEGVGFTEKEYDYAVATGKRVIPLLHKNPTKLPREKTESDSIVWDKLKKFRAKVEKKHTCVYWTNSEELKSKVIIGLTTTTKRYPAVGWVRSDQVPEEATISEVLKLKNTISELQAQAASIRDRPPEGTEDLAKGDDLFYFAFYCEGRPKGSEYPHENDVTYRDTAFMTWDDIFGSVGPSMVPECSDRVLRRGIEKAFRKGAITKVRTDPEMKGYSLREFQFLGDDTETCVVQFRALGLIQESERKRSIKDSSAYWTLTPYGDKIMVQLRAVKKLSDDRFEDEGPSEENET